MAVNLWYGSNPSLTKRKFDSTVCNILSRLPGANKQLYRAREIEVKLGYAPNTLRNHLSSFLAQADQSVGELGATVCQMNFSDNAKIYITNIANMLAVLDNSGGSGDNLRALFQSSIAIQQAQLNGPGAENIAGNWVCAIFGGPLKLDLQHAFDQTFFDEFLNELIPASQSATNGTTTSGNTTSGNTTVAPPPVSQMLAGLVLKQGVGDLRLFAKRIYGLRAGVTLSGALGVFGLYEVSLHSGEAFVQSVLISTYVLLAILVLEAYIPRLSAMLLIQIK